MRFTKWFVDLKQGTEKNTTNWRWRKWQQGGENCTMRSVMTCTLTNIRMHFSKQIQWFYVANHIQHLLCYYGYMTTGNSWTDLQCVQSTKKL